METVVDLLVGAVKILFFALVAGIVYGWVWLTWLGNWVAYRRARRDIFAFVDGYKRRCTGNNRFVVTVTALQDSFREHDTLTIEKVWRELVNNHVIQQDQLDNEWCIK